MDLTWKRFFDEQHLAEAVPPTSSSSSSSSVDSSVTRLFFQYLAIYNDEILPKSIQKIPNKGSQLCQISNKPLKYCQRFLNVC